MFEKWERDKIKIRGRGGKKRDSSSEREREKRAKRGERMGGADRGTNRFREETMTRAESFRIGRIEVRRVEATEGGAFRTDRRARAKRIGRRRKVERESEEEREETVFCQANLHCVPHGRTGVRGTTMGSGPRRLATGH